MRRRFLLGTGKKTFKGNEVGFQTSWWFEGFNNTYRPEWSDVEPVFGASIVANVDGVEWYFFGSLGYQGGGYTNFNIELHVYGEDYRGELVLNITYQAEHNVM